MAKKNTTPPRTKAVAFDFGLYDAKHRQQIAARAKKVQKLYEDAIKKIAQQAAPSLFDEDPAAEFRWQDFPGLQKQTDALLQELNKGLNANLRGAQEDAWQLANLKNDALVASLAQRVKIPKATISEWKQRNLEALDTLTNRIAKGMNLSDGSGMMQGVWNLGQFKAELELTLQTCMGQGMSAADMSREVRQYLKEPKKLFRRVRDENGVLRLSKAAKAYHPGAGVYRSSYKNALRLTATENNIAYRTADHERWRGMNFVLGIQIVLSNNHPCEDICNQLSAAQEGDERGRYPKDFKFTGWHPWCRCYAVPILPTTEEFNEYMEKKRAGEPYTFKGEQKEMPKEFNEWVDDNRDRITDAAERGKLPYFIKDNTKQVEGVLGEKLPRAPWETAAHETKPNALAIAQERHANRTQGQIDDIKARAEERQQRLRREKILADAEARHAARIPEQREAIQNAWDARKQPKETPATLREIDTAVSQYKDTDKRLVKYKNEIEAGMKHLLDNNDFAMDFKLQDLESIISGGFKNQFETGTSYSGKLTFKWNKLTDDGKIPINNHRLMQSHKVFTPSQAPFFVDKVGKYGVGRIRQYTGVQFAPSEYEKYGYLANSNKAAGVPSKYAGMYGDVTARFKKSQVQCTWTADDSLETKGDIFMQPSLTTKPSIVSFGHALPQKVKAKDLDFSSPEAFVKSAHTRYIELQYHGRLTMDMVESLTFAKDPKTILSARTIAELKLKKIDLYYKVVEDGKTIVKKYEYESQR